MEAVTCGHCGAEVPAEAVYCPKCARPVAAAPPPEEAPTLAVESDAPAPAPAEGRARTCPTPGCGQPLSACDTVCGYCGEPVAGGAVATASTLVFPWGRHAFREGETIELGRAHPPFAEPLAAYPNVGRTHARLVRTATALLVTDLDSANRTFVDGRPLSPHAPTELRPGQVLRLAANLEIEVR